MNAYERQRKFKPIKPQRHVLYWLTEAATMIVESMGNINPIMDLNRLKKQIDHDGLWQQPEMEEELYGLAEKTLKAMEGDRGRIRCLGSITGHSTRQAQEMFELAVSMRESDHVFVASRKLYPVQDGTRLVYAIYPRVAELLVTEKDPLRGSGWE